MTALPIALIGAGYMGAIYARILSQLPGVDVRAVCDVQLDKARSLAADIGCTGYVGDDVATACTVPGVHAAVIATSEAEHTAPALLALQHGLDLFVEKPLAPNVAECRQIIAAAQDGGRIVMVGHTTRFDPRFIAAHDAVQRRSAQWCTPLPGATTPPAACSVSAIVSQSPASSVSMTMTSCCGSLAGPL